ncbi:MAG TPA: OmcA/MtrC family decaheme c-type cytochrome [Polyangiaceae bacterium]|nr:OmcA/MtrC family decaheme c-type cytochrome [Polyangiaceae bacterium]
MAKFGEKLSKLWVVLVAVTLGSASLAACGDSDPPPDGDNGGADGTDTGGTSSGGSPSGGQGGEPIGTGGALGTGGTQPGVAGPGLVLTLGKVDVSDSGVATVEFTIADDRGVALDLDGYFTAGAVQPRFILSWLGEDSNGDSRQYTAYTTRQREGGGNTVTQSYYDDGGTFETLDLGKYRYTFATQIDIDATRAKLTHTLGVYATRTFLNVRYVASGFHSWVPDGGEPNKLDVVTSAACNSCHTRIEYHGGSRRGVEMCQLCHTESNSIEPISGNTFDFQVMIHKIHRGAALPSVVGVPPSVPGVPYVFGDDDDFSDVVYPWDLKDCTNCHQGSQGDRWMTRPEEKACSSCHDRTYFGSGTPPAGWTAHKGGPQPDTSCITCHDTDSLIPIDKVHFTTRSYLAPVVTAEIIAVTNTAPGQDPIVEFAVKVDGVSLDLLTPPPANQRPRSQIDRVRMSRWGPVDESAATTPPTAVTIPLTLCAATPVAPCLERVGDHFRFYSAPGATTTIPVAATGTWNVALDGRINWTAAWQAPTMAGGDFVRQISFDNPVTPVLVTGSAIVPRRHVVDVENCNNCHGDLAEHGSSGRKDPDFCVACHSPDLTSNNESWNFKDMIHRFHSSPDMRYPAPLNDCTRCHDGETYLVPLTAGLRPTLYGTTSVPPESAACTSCHSDTATKVHAESNSTASGEACATCHGDGKDRSVATVHALEP